MIDQLALLMGGFAAALTPYNLLFVLIGAVLGTAVGVLPGLGSSMAVALLLPITFALDPTAAFIMFAGVYFGGLFGDSTAAILLNTPGQSSAIASTFEGHRMARHGRAAVALATAAIGAFIGGLISTTVVVFFSPFLVTMATSFGPAEYFALAVFAFLAISSVVSESMTRGLAALMLGVALALVGIDGPSGTERFSFGTPELFDGFDIVVVTVGLLALGEVLHVASRIHRDPESLKIDPGRGGAHRQPGGLPQGPARVAARCRLRHPLRDDPRRRRRGPHLPRLRHREAPRRSAGRSRVRQDRLHQGARRPGGRGQRGQRRHGAGHLPARARPAHLPRPPRSCWRTFQQYGDAVRPAPVPAQRRPDVQPARLAVHRAIGRWPEHLPGPDLGPPAVHPPALHYTPGSPILAMLGVYAISSSYFDLYALIALGAFGYLMSGSGCRWRPC